MDEFFYRIGDALGDALRALVDAIAWVFGSLFAAMDSFVAGLTQALGIDASLFSLAFLLLGLLLLYLAARALIKRRFVGGVLALALGVLLLGWLID